VNSEEFIEYWQRALDNPDRIWPEDVLTEAEWKAGWFDRQIIMGKLTEADRATTPRWLGGDA
jgi:hypothetical protein